MDHSELLTDSQIAKFLNCPVGELPQRLEQGQIESVALRGDQRYRLAAILAPPSRMVCPMTHPIPER